MTYSGEEGSFMSAIYCPLNYQFNNTNRMFSELLTDPDQLEDKMCVCGPYNGKGLLCGECIDGYGPCWIWSLHLLHYKTSECCFYSFSCPGRLSLPGESAVTEISSVVRLRFGETTES